MINQSQSGQHIQALDGVRGLAVLAVLSCHANHAVGGPWDAGRLTGPVAAVMGWGWVGVDLFFVLSGFLITGILCDSKGCSRYFRTFYARRTLRIMPLYFGFLAVTLLLLPRLLPRSRDLLWLSRADVASLGLYYYNIRLPLTERFLGVYHAFWSLGVEEHFYLIWPVVVWAFPRRRVMHLCLALAGGSFLLRVVVVLSGAWPLTAFFLTPCRLDGLLAGSFVALAWRDRLDWSRLRSWAYPLLLTSGGLLLGLALGQGHFLPDADSGQATERGVSSTLVLTLGIAALAVCFSALIVCAVDPTTGTSVRPLLEYPMLGALGRYSYGIYICHSLVLLTTVAMMRPWGFGMHPVLTRLFLFAWAVAASFALAWVSFHGYERPFLSLKRYFTYGDRRSTGTVPTSPCPTYSNA